MPDTPTTPAPSKRPSIWRSKLMLLAIAVTIAGCGLWIYAAATRPAPTTAPSTHSARSDGLVTGFASNQPGAPAAEQTPEPRLIDDAAPAVARLGGGFIAGFCIAYALKKFIKIAAFVVGAGLIGLYALHHYGVIDVKFELIQNHLESSFAWLQGKAGSMKDFVVGYLPSGAAGITGMVVGARYR